MFIRLHLDSAVNWNPSSLLQAFSNPAWTSKGALVAIGDLVEIVGSRMQITPGTSIVSPRSVAKTGEWSWLESDVETFGLPMNRSTGLQEGDLILFPNRPPVLLGEAAKGVAFTGSFLALRPRIERAGIWLWGVLNATQGMTLLDNASRKGGSLALRYSADLLRELVPSPLERDDDTFLAVEKLFSRVEKNSGQGSGTSRIRSSWSKVVRINADDSWKNLFVSPEILGKFEGERLGDLTSSVHLGTKMHEPDGIEHGILPLVNHATTMTGKYSTAASDGPELMIEAGTLVVPIVGDKAGAIVTDRAAILGKGVFAIVLSEGVDPHRIRAFLLSEDGQKQRHALVQGVALRSLNRQRLSDFQIPRSFEADLSSVDNLQEALDGIIAG
jgi:hypothetical protein